MRRGAATPTVLLAAALGLAGCATQLAVVDGGDACAGIPVYEPFARCVRDHVMAESGGAPDDRALRLMAYADDLGWQVAAGRTTEAGAIDALRGTVGNLARREQAETAGTLALGAVLAGAVIAAAALSDDDSDDEDAHDRAGRDHSDRDGDQDGDEGRRHGRYHGDGPSDHGDHGSRRHGRWHDDDRARDEDDWDGDGRYAIDR